MEIWAKSIPISQMRWGILGDYWTHHSDLTNIRVAETGNQIMNRLLFLHEVMEDTIKKALGITDEIVDAYCDRKFAEGVMPDSDNLDSPIHDIHMFCSEIEFKVCEKCGIARKEYEDVLERVLCEAVRPEKPRSELPE